MGYLLELCNYILSFESVFIAFIFAGYFKADPRLAMVPFDLTAFFAVISFFIAIKVLIQRGAFIATNLYSLLTWLVFIAWALFSIGYSPSSEYAFNKVLKLGLLTNWAVLGAGLIVAADQVRVKRLFVLLVIAALVMAMSAIQVFMETGIDGGFVSTFGSNYLALGRLVISGSIILSIWIMFSKKIWNKIYLMCILFLLLFAAGISGGRGPLLSFLFSFAIYALITIRFSHGRLILYSNIKTGILIVLILCSVLFISYVNGYFDTTIERMSLIIADDMGDSANTRSVLFEQALIIWSNNLIFGIGLGGFPVVLGYGDIRGYPHNLVLEVLSEMGLIGCMILLLFIYYSLRPVMSFESITRNQIVIIIVMLCASTFFGAMISGDINDQRMLFAILGLSMNNSSFMATECEGK